MAEEKARDDIPKEVMGNEQISDIVLILNKMKPLVEAVSEIDKDGKAKTVPADDEHQNSFLKFDRHSSMLGNFLKNFWNQFKNPTRFGLLRMTLEDYKQNKQAIRDLSEGKQTDSVKKFLERYEIRPRNKQEEQSTNSNQEKSMADQTQQPQVEMPVAETQQSQQPRYRFNEAMINWGELKKMGISKEYLEQSGLLDTMLKGYKTNQAVPINLNLGAAVLRTDARLSFQQAQATGEVILAIHGMRKEPELDKPYFGHIFSEEDKKNLRESGNMGRVVDLKLRGGEYAPCFVSLDKQTNEVVAMRAENILIPREIKGVVLTDQEKNDLREGKVINLEGMISNNGKEFDAKIQISAERRGYEFIFDNNKQFNRQSIGGVNLTQEQAKDLNSGKAIFVEDMKRTNGDYFSSFVKLDEVTGRPNYTRFNPDTPEGSREIYIPKEMGGVSLTAEDKEDLRNGKAVFLKDMVNTRGEEFSSFVKLDLETGRPMYSKTPDGFEERQPVKIPETFYGHTFTASERGRLQDGKSLLVSDLVGPGNQPLPPYYLKVNAGNGMLSFHPEDPDRKRTHTQQASQNNRQQQGQDRNKNENQSQKQDENKKPKATRSRKIS